MILKQMIARVMRALPNLAPGTLGENDIVDLLNQAQTHLSRISVKLKVAEFELEEDTNIVPFPLDLMTLSSVYWTSDSIERELYPSMDRVPIGTELIDDDDVSTEPTRYYVKGSRVMVYPVPKVEGTVSIAYVAKPTTMVKDTDVPDLEGSEEYMIAFALQRIHAEANSPALQIWEQEKLKEEQTYMQTTDQNYRTPFQVDLSW